MSHLHPSNVERFEKSIYQALLTDTDARTTIAMLRQDIVDGVGTEEWRAALAQAIERFEARQVQA